MVPQFADTFVQVSVTGSLVRIDLGAVVVPTREGKEESRLVPTQQLVMPLDGFIRGFGLQQQAVNKLISDGVLKPNEPQDEAPEVLAPVSSLAEASRSVSATAGARRHRR